jgi:hypothetical protein
VGKRGKNQKERRRPESAPEHAKSATQEPQPEMATAGTAEPVSRKRAKKLGHN